MRAAQIGTDIAYATKLLARGELVAIPTETVYGLAADATRANAVARIFETKGRPAFNPLIVHVHDVDAFAVYAREISPLVYALAQKFSPGPITYVLPKREKIPNIVTAGGDTVAIRIPAHPMARELLRQIDFPLAAPSANPSGYVSPVTAGHVAKQLGDKISYILDGGECAVGLESTVVRIANETIEILRPGAITREMLAEFAPVTESYSNAGASSGTHASPGQMLSHYAPRVPVVIGDAQLLAEKYSDRRVGLITLRALSPSGDLAEAAQNLFTRLREFDASVDIIIAELVPNHGLGVAINDRLKRAGGKKS